MPEPRFEIDPDVTIARTIDKAFYLDTALFDAAREKIFSTAWHWLGSLDDLAARGSLAPRELLPGLLDEPVLLARDAAGVLRCLSNVCTHRASLLVQRPCRADHIRCPYHSRRFELDGRMRMMPGFEGVREFPQASDDLPELAFGEWAGHGFASLAPRWPLLEWLGEMTRRLRWLPVHEWRADPGRARCFEFDAHWALYVENYLEGLHIPFVHPALNRTLDIAGYRYRLGKASVLQCALARDGEAAFEPPPHSPDHGLRVAAYYWWQFPNLMFNFYPWGLSVNVVEPLGMARTRVLFRSFVADPSRLGEGAGAALDPVEHEDEAVVCAVQRGIRSRLYGRGRYSPVHERGLHHFHRLVASALNGASAASVEPPPG